MTCDALSTSDTGRASWRRRDRRGRVQRLFVAAGASFVLLGMLAIPVYLVAALAVSHAPAAVDWPHLGVLFADSLRATACATAVALPLGLATAIFCAHFCAPALRAWLKPALEMLEVVPTVILGLMAAVSFAPWLERHVATVLALAVALPTLLLAAGFAFGRTSRGDGWLPLSTLPLSCAAVAFGLWFASRTASPLIVPASPWNATLVGLALGVAAVPLVFTVAEDALFLVPREHTQAAFALGATRWQALATVVLPAAGSGLIAAALLGAARCLGETMIVLMASGNTAIGGFDPLVGLRSLGAEIALGMPDAAPAGTIWRDLLVATLALLASTMVLSLAAGFVRARLRRRLHRGVAA
ncbi:MAG: ABC transporter permease subunit [Dokdonella sp.]|uniref:ABC transporter permease subunit n=1 Tax=Dokdonella sp. TaxID=2291710 RepID=UPI003F7F3D06